MNQIEFGDCRETMRRWAEQGIKAQTCVTSPPYFGLRDYGVDGQIGMEQTPEEYIGKMVEVFRCVRDVLTDDGTLWLNIGDSYAGVRGVQPPRKSGNNFDKATALVPAGSGVPSNCKPKDLIGIPWMLAFALRADGWYLRQDIIWHKPNPMPESVRDRCTKAHEYIFLLSKSERYFFDSKSMREEAAGEFLSSGAKNPRYGRPGGMMPCEANDVASPKMKERDEAGNATMARFKGMPADGKRNRRSVWTVATRPYKGAHFATFPPALIEPCILAGSRPGDIVLDPFMGSGTTAQVALQHSRQYLGCELNVEYKPLQQRRILFANDNLKCANDNAQKLFFLE